jgi:sugar/nucleoside kinase (ribokinase family)
MHHDFLDEVIDLLKGENEEINVVVMPDFFLDRLVELNFDEKTFCKRTKQIVHKKGGSIDEIRQTNLRGGNAINTASALAALGVEVTPILCTSKLGQQLIRFYLSPNKLDLSHVKIFEKPSVTTAIEFATGDGKTNMMLRDVGSLADFGPNDLNIEDFAEIENAHYVCVFNWAGTKKCGTGLARTVFQRVKTKGKGKTYCDTADPGPNEAEVPRLMKNVLQSKFLDILSLNENEAVCYTTQLTNEITKHPKKGFRFEELARRSAKILASRLSSRIDLHTTSFSATFTKKSEAIVPTLKVPVLRVTGAGDAWNAGNILGDACKLSDGGRLTLANAIAAYYVSSPSGEHPTRKKLISFCKRAERKPTAMSQPRF